MAKMILNFKSEVLGFQQTTHVLASDPRFFNLNEGPDTEQIPVLYLLHGMKDSSYAWCKNTNVERYLKESGKKMIIVMPEMHNNFYVDQKIGWKYGTFMAEELPLVMQTYFNISPNREKTAIAGLSMGGYGAIRTALNYPEKFSFAATFSGVVDIVELLKHADESFLFDPNISDKHFHDFIFGSVEETENSNNDPMYLLKKVKESGKPMPKLYTACGDSDSPVIYKAHLKFANLAKELGYDIDWYTESNQGHSWNFWDKEIEKLIRTVLFQDMPHK